MLSVKVKFFLMVVLLSSCFLRLSSLATMGFLFVYTIINTSMVENIDIELALTCCQEFETMKCSFSTNGVDYMTSLLSRVQGEVTNGPGFGVGTEDRITFV